MAHVYEFIAYCYEGPEPGAYFPFNSFEYLITSKPVYVTGKVDEPGIVEAVFTTIRLNGLTTTYMRFEYGNDIAYN